MILNYALTLLTKSYICNFAFILFVYPNRALARLEGYVQALQRNIKRVKFFEA